MHARHLESLRRLAFAGQAWAHAALEVRAPLLYVAAGGYTAGFKRAVEASEQPVTMWTLDDLYRKAR